MDELERIKRILLQAQTPANRLIDIALTVGLASSLTDACNKLGLSRRTMFYYKKSTTNNTTSTESRARESCAVARFSSPDIVKAATSAKPALSDSADFAVEELAALTSKPAETASFLRVLHRYSKRSALAARMKNVILGMRFEGEIPLTYRLGLSKLVSGQDEHEVYLMIRQGLEAHEQTLEKGKNGVKVMNDILTDKKKPDIARTRNIDIYNILINKNNNIFNTMAGTQAGTANFAPDEAVEDEVSLFSGMATPDNKDHRGELICQQPINFTTDVTEQANALLAELRNQTGIAFHPVSKKNLSTASSELKGESLLWFLIFCGLYPRRIRFPRAAKAFKKAKVDLQTFQDIITALVEQIQYRQRAIAAKMWLPDWPYPSTWINDMRWLDDLTSLPEPTVKNQNGVSADTALSVFAKYAGGAK